MASVQLYRIEFIANNPFGSFVTGDVLDIFMETDDAVVPAGAFDFQAAGISVLLNGVNYPLSGAGFLSTDTNIVSIQEFDPQICVGTSLLVFGLYMAWPYSTYYSQENHYSCQVNPPTCDLIVVGVPDVVPATDEVTADGSIQITASSTNPIQYKIGSDFVYDDGTGQTETTFSGLLPGSYRIYLRDSANCGVNVLVTVTINNLYGTKYRLEYVDNNVNETRIDILRRGYIGTITEIYHSGNPFEIQLRGEGSQDKFESLLSSQANANLTSRTDEEFLELYTNDPNLYRIHYSKKFGAGSITAIVLPALSTWLTTTGADSPDWNIGTPTPNVTIAGSAAFPTPTIARSEELYTDYAFIPGDAYQISLTFDRLTNSGTANPRTGRLAITDTTFNIIFQSTVPAVEGTNTVSLVFTATADCERIIFRYTSGKNVTITVNSVSGITNGHDLKGVYKILPQQYQEEYKAPPYYVSLQATDGLPEIKNSYLIQPDGQKYYGTISLIKLVAHCLSPIKLNLPIRVACNLYAVDMDQTDSDDPFDQAYIDFECFYLAEKEPTLDFVLKSVLDAFGCRITQWEGRWNIVRVEEMLATYDYRDFDANGEYITNGSYSPVIDTEYPADAGEEDTVLVNADHNLEMRPGYGKLKAIYSLGLKPNILENGDFRLKSIYDPVSTTYYYDLNKEGWTLVNAGYPITEGYEFIDQDNIAYKISSGESTILNVNGGEAYVQSQLYSVKMGTNNQLKILVRCKVVRFTSYFGSVAFTIDVPYVKIRVRVKYGSLYLQANGTWGSSVNILTFYCTEFNKYSDYEIIAQQPTTGTPVDGMDFDIRVYHGYAFHADFTDIAGLKAFQTWDGSAQTIPTGYKTELIDRVSDPFIIRIYYYELTETTDPDDGFNIVEPTDYNVSSGGKWVLKTVKPVTGTALGSNAYTFAIDKVEVKFLTDGKDPIDTIVRTVNGENSNPYTFEKKLIIGSYSNLIVTEPSFSFSLGIFFPSGGLAITTTSTLSADLIYTGYLRSSTGEGYEEFARDGVAESDKLHGILLRSYAVQYRRSWRLLRGSIYAMKYFGLLNTARLVNDSNRIYLPMGLTLNDKMATWGGEFLEIGAAAGGSDGGGASPFSSGFTVGFGSSGFN